jgi:hypothetical protein
MVFGMCEVFLCDPSIDACKCSVPVAAIWFFHFYLEDNETKLLPKLPRKILLKRVYKVLESVDLWPFWKILNYDSVLEFM